MSENEIYQRAQIKEEGLEKLRNATEEERDNLDFLLSVGQQYRFGYGELCERSSERLARIMDVISVYVAPYHKFTDISRNGIEELDCNEKFITLLNFANEKEAVFKSRGLEDTAEILQAYFGDIGSDIKYQGAIWEVDSELKLSGLEMYSDYKNYVANVDKSRVTYATVFGLKDTFNCQ